MTARPPIHLSPQELMQLQAGAGPHAARLVVDIRPRRTFRSAHIPGSHNIPLANLVSGEPPEGDLVLIAASDQDSGRAIDALHQQGYPRRIEHLGGGFEAWYQQGLPVEGSGSHPLPDRPAHVPWVPGWPRAPAGCHGPSAAGVSPRQAVRHASLQSPTTSAG
ncbi:rhodanese-like domain-containing protein [Cyanobium sp. Morenito 9A2]|uniref:rhodanese-like domain-containing protein n=1 Tax=Cyanobium sp. Morenito 9A2 TaxID=2823718 RepID=UPI0020CF8087|nr:rhodanese-like domain-containing protein [Cyanobium sp. Morenito 9A2]MCP9848490.1 rhodanese-like domain-containing protein [Cyanobium sp. Morenito 9A2]